jgi:hypothetical protein
VQHHHVEVAARAQFASAVTTDRDEGNAIGSAEQFAQPRIRLRSSFRAQRSQVTDRFINHRAIDRFRAGYRRAGP